MPKKTTVILQKSAFSYPKMYMISDKNIQLSEHSVAVESKWLLLFEFIVYCFQTYTARSTKVQMQIKKSGKLLDFLKKVLLHY